MTALEFRARAVAAEPAVSSSVAGVVGVAAGEIRRFDSRLKGINSLNRKSKSTWRSSMTMSQRPQEPSETRFATPLCCQSTTTGLAEHGSAMHLKRRDTQRVKITPGWNRQGYRGRNDTFRTGDGFEFEVQFHTAASLAAAEETHSLYAVTRLASTPIEIRVQLRDRQNAVYARVPAPNDIRWID